MALLLLKLGVDPASNDGYKLIHLLARLERTRNYVPVTLRDRLERPPWTEENGMEEAHQKVVDWLEARGEDYQKAQQEERLYAQWRESDEYDEEKRKAFWDRITRVKPEGNGKSEMAEDNAD